MGRSAAHVLQALVAHRGAALEVVPAHPRARLWLFPAPWGLEPWVIAGFSHLGLLWRLRSDGLVGSIRIEARPLWPLKGPIPSTRA